MMPVLRNIRKVLSLALTVVRALLVTGVPTANRETAEVFARRRAILDTMKDQLPRSKSESGFLG